MKTTLAIREPHWRELCATLADERETAAFVIAASVADEEQTTLLVRQVFSFDDDDYELRERNRLQLASRAFVPALKAAAEDGSAAIFFHTHPCGEPGPSLHDELVDQQLRQSAQVRTGQAIYGSLILASPAEGPRLSGQVFIGADQYPLERLRIVGDGQLRIVNLTGEATGAERFDRQIRAFGRAGQQALGGAHVGVVGAGGTGSAVFELLVRLGVGRITIIDDDTLTESNLTRIHESATVDRGRPKVEVAAAAAERIDPRIEMEAVCGRITSLDVARKLRHCDLVFGCTDDNAGRAILSRLAYWYLVPVIDTAFLIDTSDEVVRGLFGRVTTLYPGAPCLFCRERIDSRQLAAEALPADERERLAGEGYVPGLGEPDPSVGAYTTLVAAMAVSEMLDRLFDLSVGGEAPTELLLRLHDRTISAVERPSRPGHYCVDPSAWGRGDVEPMLGQLWAEPARD